MTSLALGLSSHQMVPTGPAARCPPGLPHPVLCLEHAHPPPCPSDFDSPLGAERHISWDFTNIIFSHSLAPLRVHGIVSEDEGDS